MGDIINLPNGPVAAKKLADGSFVLKVQTVDDTGTATGGGGGGGGAATVADGADVTQGAKADAAWSGSGVGTVVSILKAIWGALTGTLSIAGPVTISPVQTDATSRSGTITTGGTAQQIMAANGARKGWLVQNQSATDLYVRSRGSAGTTDATLDQNSVKIPSGAMYVADYITANALSIIGATTGQAFFAREW